MTEERERYDWEAVVSDIEAMLADPHGVLSVTVDDALLTLAGKVYDYEQRIAALEREKHETRQFVNNTVAQLEGMADTFATAIESMSNRLNRIQDTNLAPMLESSAVIVELWGIRSALEALTKSIDGVQEANVYGQWCIRTMPFGGDS